MTRNRWILVSIIAVLACSSVGYAGYTYLTPTSIGEPQTLDYLESQTLNLTDISGIHQPSDYQIIATYEWIPTQTKNRLTQATLKLEWYLGDTLDGSAVGGYGLTFSLNVNGKTYGLGARASGGVSTQYKWQAVTRTNTNIFITNQTSYIILLQVVPETPEAILLLRDVQLYLDVVDG